MDSSHSSRKTPPIVALPVWMISCESDMRVRSIPAGSVISRVSNALKAPAVLSLVSTGVDSGKSFSATEPELPLQAVISVIAVSKIRQRKGIFFLECFISGVTDKSTP